MANLGTLTLLLEAKGAQEVINSLRQLEAQSRNLNSSQSQITRNLSSSFRRMAGDMSTGFSSANISISNANKGLLDLVQTMALLFKNGPKFPKLTEAFKLNKREFVSDLGVMIEKTRTEIQKIRDLEPKKKFIRPAMVYQPRYGKNATQEEIDLATKLANTKNQAEILRVETATKAQELLEAKINKKRVERQQKLIKELDEYLKKAKEIEKTQNSLGYKIASFWDKMVSAYENSGMPEVWNQLINWTSQFYAGAFMFAIPAITAIGRSAVKAASEMELMKMKLEAIAVGQGYTNPSQRASQMLKYTKALALPSTYTAAQLFEAGQQLSGFGLNVEKSLTPAVKLAETFGGGEELLSMVVRMMGRMAAGELPDARALGRFGINKELLKLYRQENIKTNPSMAGLSEGEQNLQAFFSIIEKRSGTILDKLGNTVGAKIATIVEKFSFAMADIGKIFLPSFNKFLDGIIETIDKLQSSGIFAEIGQAFANFFDEFSKPEMWSAIQTIVADIAAFFVRMVENTRMMMRFFVGMYFVGLELVKLIAAYKTKGATVVLGMLERGIAGDFSGMFTRRNQALPNPENWSKGWDVWFAENESVMQPWILEAQNISEKAQDYRNRMAKTYKPTSFGSVSEYEALTKNQNFIVDPLLSKLDEQQETQKEIANNTKNINDELSLRKANLGGRGGPLANLGLSYPDMIVAAKMNNSNSPGNGNSLRTTSLMNPMSMLEMGIRRAATPSFAFDRRRW